MAYAGGDFCSEKVKKNEFTVLPAFQMQESLCSPKLNEVLSTTFQIVKSNETEETIKEEGRLWLHDN